MDYEAYRNQARVAALEAKVAALTARVEQLALVIYQLSNPTPTTIGKPKE